MAQSPEAALPPAPTRLYLVAPAEIPDVEAFAAQCAELFAAADVACLRATLAEGISDRAAAALLDALKAPCHAHDVALLVENRFELVRPYGLDGAHLSGPEALKAMTEARAAIGRNAILGVDCGDSRHKGLSAGERDVDYVSFGPLEGLDASPDLRELILWWQAMIEIPCVAEIAPDPALAAALWGKADFLAPSAALWAAPEGIAARLSALAGGEVRKEI